MRSDRITHARRCPQNLRIAFPQSNNGLRFLTRPTPNASLRVKLLSHSDRNAKRSDYARKAMPAESPDCVPAIKQWTPISYATYAQCLAQSEAFVAFRSECEAIGLRTQGDARRISGLRSRNQTMDSDFLRDLRPMPRSE